MSESDHHELTNTQVLDNLRFIIENAARDNNPISKRYYTEWLLQFLVDNNSRCMESYKKTEEAKKERLAERDAKQAAEKAEEAAKEAESNKYLDRLAYLTNHYMPEIIHRRQKYFEAEGNNEEHISKLNAEYYTLSWVVHALHGELDNRVEKHRKDGDLYDKTQVHIAQGLDIAQSGAVRG